jgi:hypothetical protein
MEGERTDPGVVLPHSHALDECLFVEGFFLDCARVARGAACDSVIDCGTKAVEFFGIEKVFHDDETILLKGGDVPLVDHRLHFMGGIHRGVASVESING